MELSTVEPEPTRWALPDPRAAAPGEDIIGVGADLEPSTLLAAYRSGLFPMRIAPTGPVAWWSPDPRGVLPLDGLIVHRSLRRAARRYDVTVDTAFEDVVRGCADPSRADGWIDESFVHAYARLHELGWAHSIEVWAREPDGDGRGELVGGLYGVRINGFFAGESMFHTVPDASKVALVHLVRWLATTGATLLDVQWTTPHLVSLGAVDVSRDHYLTLLADALARPADR